MKAATGILGIVIALAVGYYIMKSQWTSLQGPTGGAPPKQVIDVAGVKMDLLSIAQAEKTYLAGHGTYTSVDQLQQDGAIAFSAANRRGYNYTAEVDDGSTSELKARAATRPKQAGPTP